MPTTLTIVLNSDGAAIHNVNFRLDFASLQPRPFDWTLTGYSVTGSDSSTSNLLQFSWLNDPRCLVGNAVDAYPYGLLLPAEDAGVTPCNMHLGSAVIPPRQAQISVVSGAFTQMILYVTIH